ncbi:MAG TPA: CPBP family intramembrane glutamic endopeptidase [Gemmataceae bacterium]|nr:CPBP family intramembrane glutamic endopeptidase [Gemmataceae bacterium]
MTAFSPEQSNEHPGKSASPRRRFDPTWGALLFALLFPSLTAWIYFVVLANRPAASGGASYLALMTYAASKAVQFAFPLAWVALIQCRRVTITRPKPGGLRQGLAFGLVVMALIFAAYFGYFRSHRMLASTPEKVLSRIQLFHADTPLRYALLTLFLAGVHSLLEEYYWRWFVFGELRLLISPVAAIVVSSFGFMAHHVILLWVYLPGHFWEAALPFSLCVAGGGAAWAWLYQRTGTLYAPWLSHLLVDVAILAVGYEMIFVPR